VLGVRRFARTRPFTTRTSRRATDDDTVRERPSEPHAEVKMPIPSTATVGELRFVTGIDGLPRRTIRASR
jgi:hypothetical protein